LVFRALAIGDIVGRPGRQLAEQLLPGLRQRHRLDFVVANAENAAGGSGLTPEIARNLLSWGVDVITTGDHIWHEKSILPYLDEEPRLIRPANYTHGKGRGWAVVQASSELPVAVINLIGRTFMDPKDCPFHAVDVILEKLRGRTSIILVDMHAEASSEKIALAWYLDGKVSAVFGTHTHVQTADERILPGGTAYLTDLGMTGPHESVIGRRIDQVLYHLTTSMRTHFDVAKGDPRLQGAIIEIEPETGRARAIERLEATPEGSDS
jgi:metallophosphoesterase (TIGR00282 family)